MNRLKAGYVKWINPFNQKPQYVAFKKSRVVVFWTKNAEPIIPYLEKLDGMNLHYYFTFTVNDYENEELEPHLPLLQKRIETFKNLSNKIGKERVIWRFDPLILSESIMIDSLLEKIDKIGEQIFEYTEKLVISFADIECYRKVRTNLKSSNLGNFREFKAEEISKISSGLKILNEKWKLQIATCSEKMDLSNYGIIHNKCVDDALMMKLWPKDHNLMKFFGHDPDLFSSQGERLKLKDKGQRKECGCIVSKDIGQYNTCGHLCVYCYANTSEKVVRKNLKNVDKNKETIV